MRINFITFSHKLTGGTRVVMELINGLAKKGHEVSLVTIGRQKDLRWIKLNARIYYANRSILQKIAGYAYTKAFGFQSWPEEETRLIDGIMPDADINVGTISYSAYAVHRARTGLPFQYFMHYEPLVREAGLKKKIMEEAYYLPNFKIANSSWLAKEIKDATGNTVSGLVFPAVDHEIFRQIKKKIPKSKGEPIKIVSLAKHKWWKGTPDALKAIQIVRDAGYKIEFSMFGNFDPVSLPEEVRSIGCEFVGLKKDDELARYYNEADILISSSFFESFPLPQIEAMACGTPVVTTRYGTEDYAFHNENALVVEPRNPDALAESIIRLIESPELYSRFIENGLVTARKFTWDSSVSQLEQVFLNALRK